MKLITNSTPWLGAVLACGTLTFALTTQAAKPVKPPPSSPAYVTVLLGGLRSSDGRIEAYASDINNSGQVVGRTAIPGLESGHYSQAFLLNPRDVNGDGKPEWFADAVDNATGAPGADGQNDLIVGLGTAPGANYSRAAAVNDPGLVVGNSGLGGFIVVPKDTDGDGLQDCWHQDSDSDGVNELMLPLGRPPGTPASATPSDLNINNAGQIIGYFYYADVSGVYHHAGFLLTPKQDTEGLWHWFQDDGNGANGLMLNLGAFLPASINDAGQIVGITEVGTVVLRNPGGSIIDLRPGGAVSQAEAINNSGQIGIWWNVDGVEHAGLLTPKDVNSDSIPDTWFQDTNSDDVNDLIVDLGAISGLENTYVAVHGLNDAGSVVGGSWHASRRDGLGWQRGGFLWENGGIQSLKSLTGGTLEIRDAYAINNARQIISEIAGGRDNPGLHACILLPTR